MQSRAYLLQGHVQGTFFGGAWYGPYKHALEGISAGQAAWTPDGKVNTIWQIVNHVTFYTKVQAEMLGGAPPRTEWPTNEETFGAPGDPSDQAGWEEARASLFMAAEAFKEAIGRLSEAELDTPRPGEELPVSFKIGDVNLHNAHHLGQIVTLLQTQGAWKPIEW